MAWVRLDDQYPDNPKVRSAGPLAELVHVRAICYAMRHLTDGFIPEAVVPSLLTGLDAFGGKEDPVRALLDAALWRTRPRGYILNDFLEYNPSRKKVREARRKKSLAGVAGAKSRWNGAKSDSTTDGIRHGTRHGTRHDVRMASAMAGKCSPSPSPPDKEGTPVVTREVDTSRVREATRGPGSDSLSRSDRIAAQHPTRVGDILGGMGFRP